MMGFRPQQRPAIVASDPLAAMVQLADHLYPSRYISSVGLAAALAVTVCALDSYSILETSRKRQETMNNSLGILDYLLLPERHLYVTLSRGTSNNTKLIIMRKV